MELTMMLMKETKNFLVYGHTVDKQNIVEDENAIVLKWYLAKETFNFLPELIKVTIQPMGD
jgi:hypothetical protein